MRLTYCFWEIGLSLPIGFHRARSIQGSTLSYPLIDVREDGRERRQYTANQQQYSYPKYQSCEATTSPTKQVIKVKIAEIIPSVRWINQEIADNHKNAAHQSGKCRSSLYRGI